MWRTIILCDSLVRKFCPFPILPEIHKIHRAVWNCRIEHRILQEDWYCLHFMDYLLVHLDEKISLFSVYICYPSQSGLTNDRAFESDLLTLKEIVLFVHAFQNNGSERSSSFIFLWFWLNSIWNTEFFISFDIFK